VIIGTHGSHATNAISFTRKPPRAWLSFIILQHICFIYKQQFWWLCSTIQYQHFNLRECTKMPKIQLQHNNTWSTHTDRHMHAHIDVQSSGWFPQESTLFGTCNGEIHYWHFDCRHFLLTTLGSFPLKYENVTEFITSGQSNLTQSCTATMHQSHLWGGANVHLSHLISVVYWAHQMASRSVQHYCRAHWCAQHRQTDTDQRRNT